MVRELLCEPRTYTAADGGGRRGPKAYWYGSKSTRDGQRMVPEGAKYLHCSIGLPIN